MLLPVVLTDVGQFLNVASTVLIVASFSGVGLMRARVINLRESLEEARAEIADKDRRITSLEASRTQDKVESSRQAADLDALKRVVTGEAHWVEISDKLDAVEELLARLLRAATERKP